MKHSSYRKSTEESSPFCIKFQRTETWLHDSQDGKTRHTNTAGENTTSLSKAIWNIANNTSPVELPSYILKNIASTRQRSCNSQILIQLIPQKISRNSFFLRAIKNWAMGYTFIQWNFRKIDILIIRDYYTLRQLKSRKINILTIRGYYTFRRWNFTTVDILTSLKIIFCNFVIERS